MATTEKEIKEFLQELKAKMVALQFVFENRDKNRETLVKLELLPSKIREVIFNLEIENYYQGPKDNDQYGKNPMWVFGAMVKKEEIYIKITITDFSVICISFHIAENSIKYPYKKNQ